MRPPSVRPELRYPVLFACGLVLAGCSLQRLAVDKVGDALSGPSPAMARDDDPEFVGAAAPFGLKLTESLLDKSPRHLGLLQSALSGFVQYDYAYVQAPAERLEDSDFERSQQLHLRARRMYLRARDYGLRALEVRHAGIGAALRADPAAALRRCTSADVATLYWLSVAWASAIGQAKDDPQLIGDLPIVDALAARTAELEPDYGNGALQGFLGSYEMARQGRSAVARAHFARAIELAHGTLAAPYVGLAEAVSIPTRQRAEFLQLLATALAIDADAHPDQRLENLVMQERARWLRDRVDDLFLPAAP